jgi:hypothetical protein
MTPSTLSKCISIAALIAISIFAFKPSSSEMSEVTHSDFAKSVLNLPVGLPDAFSVDLQFAQQHFTLELEKSRAFGKNTRFLVADKSGNLTEIERGPDRAYMGSVTEQPNFIVSAVLAENGLIAYITRPGEETIMISPMSGALHRITVGESGDFEECNREFVAAPPTDSGTDKEVAASIGAITTNVLKIKNAAIKSTTSTATLRPTRVMDVLEYEIGVEIGTRAFISDTYNSNLATAQASAQSIIGNLDARYLRGAGIKHRLGTVIIRTDIATDPLRATVTATGAATNASSSLSAFRNYWDGNAAEVGNTHDLAVYHVKSSPSGLAYVNSVGSSSRYATTGGNGATSWADGTLVHEFGHSWSLGHHDASKGTFYESKPRNNSGSNAAGGSDVFVSVMHGGGDHNIGRLSTGEALQVYNVRQGKRSFGDVVTNPGPISPFDYRDDAIATGNPITIDVIANDYDANNDVLDVRLLDTVSQQGAAVTLSTGTGPGGRNQITYTPSAGVSGTDFFHYTVCDTTGRTDWGAVYVSNNGPAKVNLNLTKYFYDLGTPTSVIFTGKTDPYERISEVTFGDLRFTSTGTNPVESRDRGSISGVNDLNRDHIRMRSAGTFHHKLATGIYDILFTIGDATENSNPIRLTAESNIILTTATHTPATFTNYVIQDLTVIDGELNVIIENLGFSSNITRIVITRVGDADPDTDNDGIDDDWEQTFFHNLTQSATSDPDKDGLTNLYEYFAGTNPTTGQNIADLLGAENDLISFGSEWFYLDDGSDQGVAWQATDFDDSAWLAGNGPLGYGDAILNTTVEFGADAANKYITTYFRREFTVPNPAPGSDLILRYLRDDGVAIYLNGTEINRNNLAANASFQALAIGAIANEDETAIQTDFVPASLLLPGRNIITAEIHQSALNSSDLIFDLSLSTMTPLIAASQQPYALTTSNTAGNEPIKLGSDWAYLDDGSNLGTLWRSPAFDVSAWKIGPSPLGYGDTDYNTTISFGTDPDNKFPTTYFRRQFYLDDPNSISNITLNVRRDDGVAVYINGVEAARDNLAPNAPYDAQATATVSGAGETELQVFTVSAAPFNLVAGSNAIAAEVHQTSPTSSDMGFNLSLNHDGNASPQDYLSLLFMRSKALAANFTVFAESSSDLQTWQTIGSQAKSLVIPETSKSSKSWTPSPSSRTKNATFD